MNRNKHTDNNLSEADREKICMQIIDTLVIQDSSLIYSALNNPKKREYLKENISKIITDRKSKGYGYVEVPNVMEYIDSIMGGYGVLDELINDETISDIKVYGYDRIRVKRLGNRESSNVSFRNNEDYIRFVKLTAIKNEIPLSDLNAVQTFTDKETNERFILRINISTSLLNSTECPYLQIRKIPKHKYSFDALIESGMLNKEITEYLKRTAALSSGIIFCGKGASGKTTLMNTMLEYIPHNKSGLVIQENEELFSDIHPDLMFQHIVTSRGEGNISYSLEDLARNGLLIDLDYFIIGEIKGNEAAHLMMANYTGHQAWTSVHGMSARESLYKLADYVKQSTDYSLNDSLRLLSGIETVIYMKQFKVHEIARVCGFDNGEPILKTVFKINDANNNWTRRDGYE